MPGTHVVEVRSSVVVKRYRRWDRGEHEREWRALNLLATCAPDLAPAPVRAELGVEPPSVTMSRLGGAPLGAGMTRDQADRLAEALTTAQRAIPAEVLRRLPFRLAHPHDLLRELRERCTRRPPTAGPAAERAYGAAVDWAGRPYLDGVFRAEHAPVFGSGDGNLANYLWDGSRVRIVDFEYSGRSDVAYELAEAVEHVTAHGALDALADRFPLTAVERARLTECRRLLALFWFLSLAREASSPRPRNPPGAAERQAERLLTLLG